MQFEVNTLINAPAATVFALYENVAQWPVWDTDVKSASIQGAFVSGARGVIVPNGGPKSDIVFSEVIRNKSFTVDCKLPLCMMRFEHELEAQGNGTRATHRVIFDGLLAPLFGRLIGSGMRKSLPKVMESLKAVAEKNAG
jgi:Polyketide cyclase / dehydrase and lipid transport